MRVIVARSNSFLLYHPNVKNNARAKRRNVVQEMSDVSPSWRDSGHSKGYLHFSPFPTETAERSPRKNAGTVQQTAKEGARIHGDLPWRGETISQHGAQITQCNATWRCKRSCGNQRGAEIIDCGPDETSNVYFLTYPGWFVGCGFSNNRAGQRYTGTQPSKPERF